EGRVAKGSPAGEGRVIKGGPAGEGRIVKAGVAAEEVFLKRSALFKFDVRKLDFGATLGKRESLPEFHAVVGESSYNLLQFLTQKSCQFFCSMTFLFDKLCLCLLVENCGEVAIPRHSILRSQRLIDEFRHAIKRGQQIPGIVLGLDFRWRG